MAIYHLSVKFISRSKGRSAIGAAAYRSGERLHDNLREQTFNYPGKNKQVLFSEILTPDGSPDWMRDREKLWNAVEAVEKRKDSQVAKEFELALPKELPLAENVKLLKEFVHEHFVKEGVVADVNIHGQDKGNENIHAHVMLTTRRVVGDGFDAKKAIDLNKKELLFCYREEWANNVNKYLSLNGHEIRIDHRSYEEQGIGLVPQNKRGPKFTRKRLIEKTQEHLEIARQNGEKIYQDPKIALHALSVQHSTFTKQDIARFVNRHTADSEQFTRVFEKVYSSPELVVLGMDQKENERYSYKEMVQLEKEMLNSAQMLSEKYTHDVSNPEHDRISMMVSRVGRNIKEAFVQDDKHFDYATLSEEQKIAVEHITKGNDLSCVLGYAGTGKSYMLGAARELWEKEGYRVRGLSLTGVAARGLEDGSGIKSQTIARQFRSWENSRGVLSERDIVVLDEVGMVSSRQLYRVLAYVKNAGAKLVTTGDFSQIPPIEAGAAARAVMEKVGYVELTEVRRQIEPWQQEATKQLARGEIEEAIDSYYQRGYVHKEKDGEGIEQQMLNKWAKNLIEQPDKTQIMIAFTNEEVKQLNLHARDLMGELGLLDGDDHEVNTYSGKLKVAEHEKILFLRNNYDLGVMNGMLGEISAIKQNEISVVINQGRENQQEVTFNVDEYNYFTYGYAATIHKLQGATFDNTQVLTSKYFNRNLANVAFTRHRHEMNIYHPHSDIPELVKTLSRDGGKDTTLDYPYITKEILNYREIQPLGDLGYMAFHHRELVKELELIGDKATSFITSKQERGFFAGMVEHNDKRYVILEQEKEFKLYNQKCFDDDEKELINSVGCFVAITKSWDENRRGFNAMVSNTGLSLLESDESYEAKEQNIFVLGKGVEEIQNKIASLESRYHKPINFSAVSENIYGIYRGSANVGEKEYGVVETVSGLRMLSKEGIDGIKNNKWVVVGDNQRAVAINQKEAPVEYIFNTEVKQTVDVAQDGFVVSAIHESREEHYEVEEIKRMLTHSADTVVEHLMGEPNTRFSSSVEWRYGNKGSLAISIAGEKSGFWYNFETGESGNLIQLIQKRTGMGFAETLKYATNICGGSYLILPSNQYNNSKHIQSELEHTHKEVGKTSEYAQKLIADSKPIEGTIVEKYLKEIRGINNINGADLRYHPKVFTNKQETQQYLPAMLSIGRDKDGNVRCVQATYLDPKTANKAELDVNKRTYASPSGALVYLQKQEETISDKTSYVAEGVETGLSIKDAVEDGSVVVTLGKSNFAKIDPQGVGQKVVFCLDNDGSSTLKDNTIHKAAERLISFGKEVFITIPESKEVNGKVDLNDVARRYGIDAVRNVVMQPVPYIEWKHSIENEVLTETKKISESELLSKEEVQADKDENTEINRFTKDPEELNDIEQNTQDKTVKELVDEIRALSETGIEQETSIQRHIRELRELSYEAEQSSTEYKEKPSNQNGEKADGLEDLKGFQERFERENPELSVKICEEVNGVQGAQDSHERSLEQSLSSRLEKIKAEASKFIDSINKQEELKKGESLSPAVKETVEKSKAEVVKCLREYCGRDKEMLNYIKTQEPRLFTEINKVCNNVLNNTLELIESKEPLTKLTQAELYEKTILAEKNYKELKDKYTNSIEEVTKVFKVTGNLAELPGLRAARDAAKEEFRQYAHNMSVNIDLIKSIEQHHPELFKEMNKSFNNIFIEAIKRDNLQQEYARTHIELFDKSISKEARIAQMHEHYLELKKEYTNAQEGVTNIFTVTGNLGELKECRENRDMAEDTLERYSNAICRDKDFMDYLSKNDSKEFNELNERFNEIMQEQLHEMQQELEKDI